MIKIHKITVVGFGNMAEAIIRGLLDSRLVKSGQVSGFEPNPKRQNLIKKKYNINFSNNSSSLLKDCDVVLLAVKPQNIKEALLALSDSYNNQLVISVVTGITIKTYQKYLGSSAKIIRVMPNTPALIGEGAAVYFAGKRCLPKDKKVCEAIFSCVGIVSEIKNENLLDAVTAISGSGPAFVYHYAEAVIQSAVKLGLSEKLAKSIVFQTLLGATKMMIQSSETPAELTKKVTSKGGTTLAGLKILKKKGFTKMMESCMISATKRAKELSHIFGK